MGYVAESVRHLRLSLRILCIDVYICKYLYIYICPHKLIQTPGILHWLFVIVFHDQPWFNSPGVKKIKQCKQSIAAINWLATIDYSLNIQPIPSTINLSTSIATHGLHTTSGTAGSPCLPQTRQLGVPRTAWAVHHWQFSWSHGGA